VLGSQRWLLGLPWIRWAGTWPARPLLECGPSLHFFQFSKRSVRRVSITVRRSCAWPAWRRDLLSNLQSRSRSHGEPFLFDQKLASFDERFAGADISVAEPEEGASNVLNFARLPSPGPGERAIVQSETGRSVPKLAPAASSPPASAARKRVATAEASKDSISPADDDSRTAIYDIAARTVYLPNGRRLEAHSGLGSHMDDARYVNLKRLGPTPPNTYKLVMREEPFHGVRAIRLIPVGDGKMFGRDGLLAHSYMLGPDGQSNGCVSFSDYPAFLDAYLKGEVDRLVVVEHLATAPGPKTASGWLPEFIKDLFRRS
jgi:Protein of unknown function (DUF2778)